MNAVNLNSQTIHAKALADAMRSAGWGEDEELIADTIEGESDAMEAISKVLQWIALRQAHADAIKAVEADLAARRTRMAESVESGRRALATFMDVVGLSKIERPEATLSMRDGNQSVVYSADFDPETLPKNLQRMKVEADKKAIKEALDRGQAIPGCYLSNAPRVLTVRVK